MERILELPEAPPAALLDGAIAIALAAGVTLRLEPPLDGAGAEVVQAAAMLSGDDAAVEAVRAALARRGRVDIDLPRPRPGVHSLSLREPSSVARVATALSWPLGLLGRPSELRLRGINHCAGAPGFHELSLSWVLQASAFGLRARLELRGAAFAGDPPEQGELLLTLDPAPALTPLHLAHRGLLRQVTVLGASGSAGHDDVRRAVDEAVRLLRLHGVNASGERVPLPLVHSGGTRRWVLTAVAELENSVVSVSAVPAPGAARLQAGIGAGGGPAAGSDREPEALGAHAAGALNAFLSSRGALDGPAAERMLVPAILCASGLGARAGPPPQCHFSTTEVTAAQVALAALAHTVLPVRAAIDGLPGEEGVVVVAPN
ncbi:MAG TPA: RNA 3'-terminal phosphate cyclase [Myxococcales bacterium]|jgi:RNA 3'-terminal phosphate cyclase|nr:RNA 3'-terminal phosphate cyclase [Myxococcales bacterium]